MASQIASTSRLMLRGTASRALVSSRHLATGPSAASTATTVDQSSASSSAFSAPSSVPAAYQRVDAAPTVVTRESLSYSPTSRGSFGVSGPAHPYRLNVFSSRNNTILTLTTTPTASDNDPFHPVAWVSAGSAGYKGAQRGTYDAAVEVSLRMFKKIADMVNPPILSGGQKIKVTRPKPTEVEIVWKGFGQGRDAVLRTLLSGDGDSIRGLVSKVMDATPLKIGGTRPKKRRVI